VLTVPGLEPGGILEGEVAVQHVAGLGEPGASLLVVIEELGELRLFGDQPFPLRREHGLCGLRRPVRGGLVEQPLEDRVHQRPSRGGGTRRLGQPVDHPEPVEQRAGQEVTGARG
jgi:hypothetical protein